MCHPRVILCETDIDVLLLLFLPQLPVASPLNAVRRASCSNVLLLHKQFLVYLPPQHWS